MFKRQQSEFQSNAESIENELMRARVAFKLMRFVSYSEVRDLIKIMNSTPINVTEINEMTLNSSKEYSADAAINSTPDHSKLVQIIRYF